MASLVVGIVFISLYTGITFGTDLISTGRENLRATQIMEQKLEEIRLFNWSQITSNGFVPATFTANFDPYNTNSTGTIVYNGSVTISNSPFATEGYKSNMVTVVVNIQWSAGKTSQKRTMSTLVSQYGIQNYIY